jgi:hypothetical protein
MTLEKAELQSRVILHCLGGPPLLSAGASSDEENAS